MGQEEPLLIDSECVLDGLLLAAHAFRVSPDLELRLQRRTQMLSTMSLLLCKTLACVLKRRLTRKTNMRHSPGPRKLLGVTVTMLVSGGKLEAAGELAGAQGKKRRAIRPQQR